MNLLEKLHASWLEKQKTSCILKPQTFVKVANLHRHKRKLSWKKIFVTSIISIIFLCLDKYDASLDSHSSKGPIEVMNATSCNHVSLRNFSSCLRKKTSPVLTLSWIDVHKRLIPWGISSNTSSYSTWKALNFDNLLVPFALFFFFFFVFEEETVFNILG